MEAAAESDRTINDGGSRGLFPILKTSTGLIRMSRRRSVKTISSSPTLALWNSETPAATPEHFDRTSTRSRGAYFTVADALPCERRASIILNGSGHAERHSILRNLFCHQGGPFSYVLNVALRIRKTWIRRKRDYP